MIRVSERRSPASATRRRVALGPIEIAGVCSALAKGLRGGGHQAELVVVRRHWLGYPYDKIVDGVAPRLVFGVAAPARYDVLHYHFGFTWFLFFDAAWARLWRRLLVMHYHGDDCRLAEVALRDHPERARVTDARKDRRRKRRLRRAARWCSAAIVGDLELLSYVRLFFERVYLLPICVDIEDGAAPPRPSGRSPLVLHAASDPAIKGTAEVRRILDDVSRRVNMRVRILTGRPHAEVLAAIAEADIVIDQFNSETYGVFAVEAMSRGKPVLCQIDRAKLAPRARSVPIVEASVGTLAARLEELLSDREKRERMGAAGWEFARRLHAPTPVAAAAERIYEHVAAGPARGVYEATPEGVSSLV